MRELVHKLDMDAHGGLRGVRDCTKEDLLTRDFKLSVRERNEALSARWLEESWQKRVLTLYRPDM